MVEAEPIEIESTEGGGPVLESRRPGAGDPVSSL